MSPENQSSLFLVVLLGVAVAFPLIMLSLARVWATVFTPNKPGPTKNASYECGVEASGDAWVQLRSGYYVYAIVFLIFDVETLFLLPFAVAFTSLPVGAFVAIMVFLLLLVEGLVWAWKKGVLEWS
jgi:NADH-quinone oxidoreductase subunit A